MPIFLGCEVELHLCPLHAVHVFLHVGRIGGGREHKGDHERRIDNLAETEVFQNLKR